MSQVEASRLAGAADLSDGPGLQQAATFATSVCSDLARWALEHNCILGPIQQQQREEDPFHYYTNHSNQLSSLNNVTSIAQLHQQQQQQLQQSTVGRNQLGNLQVSTITNGGEQAAALGGGGESPLSQPVVNYLVEPLHHLESKVNYYFSDIWLTSGDERTNDLPFIGSGPWTLIYATLIYLYLIKWLLPRIMKPLRPLELNWPIRLYNLFMVVSNMWAFYHGARILNFGLKCFGCETINHHDRSSQAIELLHYGWLFFISRIIEWLDTIFFVLRKKERQVTKLHVFHHSFVPLISWTYLKYHPGYTVAFFPFVNSLVHSIMYTYYLLATFGPKLQPYLWWKRYLTSLQIVQFVLIIIQLASIPLTGDETCQYPRGFLYVAFAGAGLFLWLFYTYYMETYTTTTTSRNKQVDETKQRNGKTTQLASSESLKSNNGSNNNNSNNGKVSFGTVRNLARVERDEREGSSRSLSDAIDNAISCEPDLMPSASGAGPSKKKAC
uniref:Elongation of very long chain fatty acids protein n=1 Tax=Aceria tosichella TaxID=561515 RepID=A0A6G1SH21_9ACAR